MLANLIMILLLSINLAENKDKTITKKVDINPNKIFDLSNENRNNNCLVNIVKNGDNKTSDRLLTPR